MVPDTIRGQEAVAGPDLGPYRSAVYRPTTDLDSCEIDRCMRCGGVWFDAGELVSKLRHEAGQDVIVGPGWASAQVSRSSETTCPRCKVEMGLYNCSAIPWLKYSRCSRCDGMWLAKADVERLEDPMLSVLALGSGEFAKKESAS
jgi:Zn-finger nucleic acid-binding protein